jgi:hypothetical protein
MYVLVWTLGSDNSVERLNNFAFTVNDNGCDLNDAICFGVDASGLKVDNSE